MKNVGKGLAASGLCSVRAGAHYPTGVARSHTEPVLRHADPDHDTSSFDTGVARYYIDGRRAKLEQPRAHRRISLSRELNHSETLASLMGPVVIVDGDHEHSRIVARAVRSICPEVVALNTCEDARVWLDCARSHYVVIYPAKGDRSHIELLSHIGRMNYKLPVAIIGGRDQAQRSEMRNIASDLQMTFYTFPYPVELSVLRVLLADQRSKTAGLPVVHTWGGMKVDTVVARHRQKRSAE